MDGSIHRDLFHTTLELYPRQKSEVAKAVAPTVAAPVEDPQEAGRRLVLAEARALVLESTMVGQSSVATINGKMFRVGDWFGGFELVKITAHSCIVRKTDITVILEIQHK
jgi:hypothetical protein